MLLQKLTAKDRKQHVTYSKPCSAPHNRVTEASELNSMISEPQHVHSASFMTSVTSACLSLASLQRQTLSTPLFYRRYRDTPCRRHCFSAATGQTLSTPLFQRRYGTDPVDASVSASPQDRHWRRHCFSVATGTDPVDATVSASLQDRPCRRHCFSEILATPLFQRRYRDRPWRRKCFLHCLHGKKKLHYNKIYLHSYICEPKQLLAGCRWVT